MPDNEAGAFLNITPDVLKKLDSFDEKLEKIEKHAQWVAEFLPKYPHLDKENIQQVLREEVGQVFVHVLEDAGVYKCTPKGRDAFMRFVHTL